MKKDKSYIAIIDYQLSNLFSVKHALDSLKVNSVITSDPNQILKAKAAILPGVGAFGDAMTNLAKLNLIDPIKKFVSSQKPFMGVCLGMQLLFQESFEFGQHQGLGLIKGKVKKFPKTNQQKQLIRIPQIAWNQIYFQPNNKKAWQSSPLSSLVNRQYMYFVHSYYVKPQDQSIIASYTDYSNFKYCSSLIKGNIFATQFHPEKSGPKGIEIYSNWIYN